MGQNANLTKKQALDLYSYGFRTGVQFPGADPGFIIPALDGEKLPVQDRLFDIAVDHIRKETCAGAGVQPKYLTGDNSLILHFEFEDKSNPYVFFGEWKSVLAELRKWSRNWAIRCVKNDGHALYATLSEKSN